MTIETKRQVLETTNIIVSIWRCKIFIFLIFLVILFFSTHFLHSSYLLASNAHSFYSSVTFNFHTTTRSSLIAGMSGAYHQQILLSSVSLIQFFFQDRQPVWLPKLIFLCRAIGKKCWSAHELTSLRSYSPSHKAVGKRQEDSHIGSTNSRQGRFPQEGVWGA